MAKEKPRETDTARDIVRKAQLEPAILAIELGDIWGTFSKVDSAGGYALSYPSGRKAFPDGTNSMSRYSDITGLYEVRLLVSVAGPGVSGATISVESAAIATPLSVSIAAAGVILSGWQSITEGSSALMEWFVDSPSVGTATIGLCQLQGR